MTAAADLRCLGPQDLALLCSAGPEVFDNPVDPEQAAAFLADPANLIVVALVGGAVAGFASGTILRHPDKPPSLFVNEVGVAEPHRRRGLALQLVARIVEVGRARGAQGAWVATEGDNGPARALYARAGGRETGDVVVYDWDGAMDGGRGPGD